MADISVVPGITGSTLELFRAAGIETVESLVSREASALFADLDRANGNYEVAVRLPSEELVRAWQESARAMLKKARAGQPMSARPVPEERLRAAGIDVAAIPEARVVTDYPQRRPSPLGEESPVQRESRPERTAGGRKKKQATKSGPILDRTGREGQLSVSKGRVPVPSPKSRPGEKGSPAKPRTGLPAPPEFVEEAGSAKNRFRSLEVVQKAKPQGERRNRGMSHPDAGRVRFAAVVTVLALLGCVLAGLSLVSALVMARLYGWHFHWTIALILLVFPAALICYLSIGTKARCRLCGQKLFVPKHCRKHQRARRSMFGYTYAVARDAMLFGNYRCMLCGTKTRLKG